MYKIIGADKQEYGPVSEEQVRRWILDNRANGQTQIRHVDSESWKTLSELSEFSDIISSLPPPIQPVHTAAPQVSNNPYDALNRDTPINIGSCFSRGIATIKDNLGVVIPGVLLAWIILNLLNFVPLVGPLILLAVAGPIYGGLNFLFLNIIRNNNASPKDVFKGFSLSFGHLLLAFLLTGLLQGLGIACCLILPGIYLIVAWMFTLPLVIDKRMDFWSAMQLSRKAVNRQFFPLLGLMILVYLPTLITNLYVQFEMMESMMPIFMEMMEAMQSGQMVNPQDYEAKLMEAAVSVGPLLLITQLVVLLNLPFIYAALMHAYEDIFGSRAANESTGNEINSAGPTQ